MNDRPRRIQKKEIAAEIAVSPKTLSALMRGGLILPRWPCTMAECVAAVREFRERLGGADAKVKSG